MAALVQQLRHALNVLRGHACPIMQQLNEPPVFVRKRRRAARTISTPPDSDLMTPLSSAASYFPPPPPPERSTFPKDINVSSMSSIIWRSACLVRGAVGAPRLHLVGRAGHHDFYWD
ncbi:hypothetical protein FA95DRAFT_1613829 [Auriscalpium vulgare]|uniref:Uncharacterized protein n=1 Tax=Auriscalpium vulgare TaxID=40419 RepID=A0ACB8R147_9AGAM|nr:hypothetical protein FA95DRAFT_1613829 [Auriscalpium vulgare]